MADARKPLVSAYKCKGHGRMAILDVEGGQLVPAESKKARPIKSTLQWDPAKAREWIPVYQEKGVYNFYLRKPGYQTPRRRRH